MPPIERTDLRDAAVLWPVVPGGYDHYGEVLLQSATPISLAPWNQPPNGVRWNNRQTRMLDPQGQTVAVDATVVVNIDIEIGSIMWHGDIADLPVGTGSYQSPDMGLYIVKVVSKTPDIKQRHFRRTVGLMRFRDQLPSVNP